jgi:hypothetical protein
MWASGGKEDLIHLFPPIAQPIALCITLCKQLSKAAGAPSHSNTVDNRERKKENTTTVYPWGGHIFEECPVSQDPGRNVKGGRDKGVGSSPSDI